MTNTISNLALKSTEIGDTHTALRAPVTWMTGGRGLGRSGQLWSISKTGPEGLAEGRREITLRRQGLYAASFDHIDEARAAAEAIEAARYAQVQGLTSLAPMELLMAHRGQRHLIAMLEAEVLLDPTELAVVQNRMLEEQEQTHAIERALAARNVHAAPARLN